ncbi:MAG: hypothetical protein JXJ17_04905 [Anaerolineae bacterium]|nr:hypothetical protein [Anaerolineae bacterium]
MANESKSAPAVTIKEWGWVIIVSLLLMAFVSMPYVVGLNHSTPEMRFGGFLLGVPDMNSYIAKMRYGAYNGWLLQIVYTHEPHASGFAYLHYIALGKLAAWISGEGAKVSAGTLIVTFHVARVLCGLLLLAVMYRFIALFLDVPPKRRLAWILASAAGGVGWLPTVLSTLNLLPGWESLPVETYVPEAFTILLLYSLPHLSLARAMMLVGWMGVFFALERKDRRWIIAVGLAWGVMGVIVPFYIGLLGVLIAAWLIMLWITRREIPWDEFKSCALAAAIPVGLLIYNAWLFSTNPVFAGWAAQNDLPSPPLIDYLLAYGLLLILSVIGLFDLRKDRLDDKYRLLIVWIIAAAMLVYMPLNVQRRLLEGVIVPLSILATVGVFRLVGEKPGDDDPKLGWRLRQIAMGTVIMLILPSTLLVVGGGALTATRLERPVFHSVEEIEAMNWLRDEVPQGSIVLASQQQSNVIPAYAGVRTYIGQGPETNDDHRKNEIAKAFLFGGMADDERREFLDEIGVDYILIGPLEQAVNCVSNCFDPAALDLEAVYTKGDYTIYRVGD